MSSLEQLDRLSAVKARRWLSLFVVAVSSWSRPSAASFNAVVLVKVGGSSITMKAHREVLDEQALRWFARTISTEVSFFFRAPDKNEGGDDTTKPTDVAGECAAGDRAFVIVHGAGSFGHHSAKAYGLKGQFQPPSTSSALSGLNQTERRRSMHGVSETRLSVQKLNQIVVSALVDHGVNAVGLSPCFSIPGMEAHGGGRAAQESLRDVVRSALRAGLVPVLHGDACLHGSQGAGILSGDTLMEILGSADWVSSAVFLTDVDGVYTRDPRSDPQAQLLRSIEVDASTSKIRSVHVEATASAHDHDVTGGLATKLAAAVSIAAAGINVTIAKCGSRDAEKALRGGNNLERATLVYRL